MEERAKQLLYRKERERENYCMWYSLEKIKDSVILGETRLPAKLVRVTSTRLD